MYHFSHYICSQVSVIGFIFLLHLIQPFAFPLPRRSPYEDQDYELEERRKPKRRQKKPCGKNNADKKSEGIPRWFLGHDLTLFLGDVTICGTYPYYAGSQEGTSDETGNYEGVIPVIHRPPQKPQRPHRPHRPHRPNSGKPVYENTDDDEVQDNYYRPESTNHVNSYEHNLSNFTPSRIISTLSKQFNRYVNPWVNLFFK